MCRDRVHCVTGLVSGRPTVRFAVGFVAPQGCRWCAVPRRYHGWRWTAGHGLHGWAEPTRAQVTARLRDRLAHAKEISLRT